MAQLSVNGLSELSLGLEELAKIPDEVLDRMLSAEADVFEQQQKAMARAYGVNRTGQTIASIGRGKIEKKENKRSLSVYPRGTNKDGDKNTEVAFINEYGKRQDARPFIHDANEQADGQAAQAAETIYDTWMKQHNF